MAAFAVSVRSLLNTTRLIDASPSAQVVGDNDKGDFGHLCR